MITKKNIKEFVEKVARKAQNSITSQKKEALDKAMAKFLEENPAINKIINDLDSTHKLFIAKRETAAKLFLDKNAVLQYREAKDYHGHVFETFNSLDINFKEFIFNQFLPKSPSIDEIKERFDIEARETKAQYNALLHNVDGLTPHKALEYLKNLGFDTKSIEEEKPDNILPLDSSKLFVCGDNK